MVLVQHEIDRGNPIATNGFGQAVQPHLVPADCGQGLQFVWSERGLIHQIDQRIEVLEAGHRNVDAVLFVEARQGNVVEAVDIDDEIELLAYREKVSQQQ